MGKTKALLLVSLCVLSQAQLAAAQSASDVSDVEQPVSDFLAAASTIESAAPVAERSTLESLCDIYGSLSIIQCYLSAGNRSAICRKIYDECVNGNPKGGPDYLAGCANAYAACLTNTIIDVNKCVAAAKKSAASCQ